jgi:predicted FMN-binding regulatory protein PaiB
MKVDISTWNWQLGQVHGKESCVEEEKQQAARSEITELRSEEYARNGSFLAGKVLELA